MCESKTGYRGRKWRVGLLGLWWIGSGTVLAQGGECPEAAFHRADADGNGQLNLPEFVQALECYGPFRSWDTDGDGYIAPREFRQAGKVDFPLWDADRDGTLSRSEFNAGLYQAWDLNGDGQIDLEAWCRAVASGWLNP